MAKILTTKGSAAALEDIIRRAEKEIFLISFSFIISDSFINRIKQAADKGVKIHLVYGKSIKPESLQELNKIQNVIIYQFNNLHAKLFANETKCIIGSMNFSEASEINNTEIGVLLSTQNDKEAFDDAMQHCKEIMNSATLENHKKNSAQTKIVEKNKNEDNPQWLVISGSVTKPYQLDGKEKEIMGYCIRTRKRIPLNHERPFCEDAYFSWAEWGNDDYEEQYDHFTGEESYGETTKANPILHKNWKKYQKTISTLTNW